MGPLPDLGPAIAFMFIMTIIGLIALVGGAGWPVWWLFNHVSLVV